MSNNDVGHRSMLLLVAGGHYDHGGNNATGTATAAGGVPGMIIVSIYFLLILALVVVGFIPYLWLHLILPQPTAVLLHLLFASADHDRQSLVAVSSQHPLCNNSNSEYFDGLFHAQTVTLKLFFLVAGSSKNCNISFHFLTSLSSQKLTMFSYLQELLEHVHCSLFTVIHQCGGGNLTVVTKTILFLFLHGGAQHGCTRVLF